MEFKRQRKKKATIAFSLKERALLQHFPTARETPSYAVLFVDSACAMPVSVPVSVLVLVPVPVHVHVPMSMSGFVCVSVYLCACVILGV